MNALGWIQVICSVGALVLAAWSLAILKEYAADTKKIAEASVFQLENLQIPFVTPVSRLDEGWGFENQGPGPAINAQLCFVQEGAQVYPLPCIAPSTRVNAHNVFAGLVGNQGGIEIHYESLSGRKYRTIVTWGDAGTMHVRFEKLPAERA